MKVKDLIKLLKKCNQNKKIRFWDDGIERFPNFVYYDKFDKFYVIDEYDEIIYDNDEIDEYYEYDSKK